MKGGGKTIILGAEMHGSPLCLNPYEILSGKCVMGSLLGGIKAKTDIPTLINKYLNKVILHTL
jgi:S-(hydroxymethyl)glutathione dehydrogenase / alcohol dehydrogenase